MFSIIESVPGAIREELIRLNNQNRLIKKFAVVGCREYEPDRFSLGIFIPDEDRRVWGGFRKSVESQLVSAGVCYPAFTAQQELKWRELRQILYQFYDKETVDAVIFEECRNAYLHGWIDSLQKKIPLATFLRCKQIISDLGADYFSANFELFSGKSPQEFHESKGGRADFWRGLEE